MAQPSPDQQPGPPSPHGHVSPLYQPPRPRWGFFDYFWFILKNILGWALILAAWPVGLALPGPGGIPLFLIGFALITFPGKRNLTARVLRGILVNPDSRGYRILVAAIAILLPAGLLAWLAGRWWPYPDPRQAPQQWFDAPRSILVTVTFLCLMALIWIFGLKGVHLINALLRALPRLRRRVRPWLRGHGMDLLPPRRRHRLTHPHLDPTPDEGILSIHERHQHRALYVWAHSKPWIGRAIALAITAAIFFWMLRPLVTKWDEVRLALAQINWRHFALASIMFALFLFAVRVISWWRILAGLGHRLPLAAATRIWSVSELARYLPLMIWQVIGRAYLCRPYGVSGPLCSTSQALEIFIFLLANLLVAISCLLYLGLHASRQLHYLFIAALALAPVLLLLLHPPVFQSLLNRILHRMGRPPVEQGLKKRQVFFLGLLAIAGLLWQSLAIWLILHRPLELPLAEWWIIAGAYCLAWCAGFLAFWAPGGIGVREVVFVLAMELALPPSVRQELSDPAVRAGFLAFLALILRLWATCGELIVAFIAHAADYKGALGHPDAPGRVALSQRLEGPGEKVTG